MYTNFSTFDQNLSLNNFSSLTTAGLASPTASAQMMPFQSLFQPQSAQSTQLLMLSYLITQLLQSMFDGQSQTQPSVTDNSTLQQKQSVTSNPNAQPKQTTVGNPQPEVALPAPDNVQSKQTAVGNPKPEVAPPAVSNPQPEVALPAPDNVQSKETAGGNPKPEVALPAPEVPIAPKAVPTATIKGSSVIHEGGWQANKTNAFNAQKRSQHITADGSSRQNYSITLDQPVEKDTVFTIKINDGTAKNAKGIPTIDQLSYTDKARDGLKVGTAGLVNDFTVFDSKGQSVKGDTIQVLVKAGQTESEQFSVQAWEEVGRYSAKGVEGDEKFSMSIVGSSEGEVNTKGSFDVLIKDKHVKTASPIAIDLDGDGKISTTGNSTAKDRIDNHIGATVKFDLSGDGQLEEIEWMEAFKDGLLVDTRKIGANNEIDGHALFGDLGGKYKDGFEKLAELDVNGDGQLTGDELEHLAVWVDNGDAKLEQRELRSLAEVGITQLSTQRTDVLNERGESLMRSTANNGQVVTEDVWFASKG